MIALVVTGTSVIVAVAGYGVVLFAGFVAVYEIIRGAQARRRRSDESWLTALLGLFRRNQRRYGGYIVHLGVTVIGIGIIGSTVFQTEVQYTLDRGGTVAVQDYLLRFDSFVRAQAVGWPHDEYRRGILVAPGRADCPAAAAHR